MVSSRSYWLWQVHDEAGCTAGGATVSCGAVLWLRSVRGFFDWEIGLVGGTESSELEHRGAGLDLFGDRGVLAGWDGTLILMDLKWCLVVREVAVLRWCSEQRDRFGMVGLILRQHRGCKGLDVSSTTEHGFCRHVLQRWGVGLDPTLRLVVMVVCKKLRLWRGGWTGFVLQLVRSSVEVYGGWFGSRDLNYGVESGSFK